MTTSKRTYEEVDPDYADTCEQQTKRQRELEQDAKQTVVRRVQGIVRNEFRKEINNKELELHHVDRRLNEARLMMDRLRACIVSTYYGQINQSGTSETSRVNGPASSIHPSVKKYLGKKPSEHEMSSNTSVQHTPSFSRPGLSFIDVSDCAHSISDSAHSISDSRQEQQNSTSDTHLYQSPPSAAGCSTLPVMKPAVPFVEATYDDRRARFKIKKKIIIGNVSKYIPVDHREANDKSSHKWMVYVRGPKSEPNISGFVKKVWFFLHHSYKPNDLVEISSPPFHLTRRGWGEFPVRVQLHFVDPRNKKVDIIHQLKLDKTFSGLQTLGAETAVEVELEKDFFESDTSSNENSSCMRPISDYSSSYHRADQSSSSILNTADLTDKHLAWSQNGRIASEQSSADLVRKLEADNNKINKNSMTDINDTTSECQITLSDHDSCVTKVSETYPACETEGLSDILETNVTSLEEYNVTIVHDTDEYEDNSLKKERIAMDMDETVSDRLESRAETSNTNSPAISDSHSCVSASSVKVHPSTSSVLSSTKTALTIISKPQWISPGNVSISDKSNSVLIPLQISQLSGLARLHSGTSELVKVMSATTNVIDSIPEIVSACPLQQNSKSSSSAIPVPRSSKTDSGSVQPHSYILMDTNGHSVKPIPSSLVTTLSSPVTNAKDLCSSLPSLFPLSLSVLPKSSTTQNVRTIVACSGQSSAQASLSSPQHIALNACTTSGHAQSVVEPSVMLLSQQVQQQMKENTSDVQKIIFLKPNTSVIAPEVVGSKAVGSESKSLLQLKPSGTRQVSLLTGRVFTPQTTPLGVTKTSSPNHGSNESLLASNRAMAKQIPEQTAAFGKPTNQIAKSVSTPAGQLLLLKTMNHSSVSASQSTGHQVSHPHSLTNQVTTVDGLLAQGLTSQLENVSIVNVGGSAENLPMSVSLFSNSVPVNNSNIQASQNGQMGFSGSSIILHAPGQEQSQLLKGQHLSVYPKMSAIGITKLGKNSATVSSLSTNSRSTTDAERKKNQYEVLMAWKRNRLLHEKAKQVVRISRDRIEEEADIIPELKVDDYNSMGALMKAAVKLHPLVQAGINKLTHPYCAESLEQWITWTLGKQLASEWHRACFVLRYLKPLLRDVGSFKGEQLMTTRQLVRWCRLHAFSPLVAVVKAKPGKTDESTDGDSKPLQNCGHVPSFTPADSLDLGILADSAENGTDDSSRHDVEIVNIDADSIKKLTSKIPEPVEANITLEWLPPSDGALFVYDELQKRGIQLQPSELQPGVMSYTAADMLYMVMQEFIGDVLRETVAVGAWQTSESSAAEITRTDVHTALSKLPEASFSCNKFLGKAEVGSDR